MTPEQFDNLLKDWADWVRQGKTFPCSSIGHKSQAPYSKGAGEPATRRTGDKAEGVPRTCRKPTKGDVFHVKPDPVQKSSRVSINKSRNPGLIHADRQLEALDRMINQLPWSESYVLRATYIDHKPISWISARVGATDPPIKKTLLAVVSRLREWATKDAAACIPFAYVSKRGL